MKELFYINDKDCWTEWKLVLTKGTLGILSEPPKRKAQLEHSWPDENGTERDVSTNYFESKEMKIPCAIIADSLADFKSNFDSLMTEIRGTGYFDFDSTGLDRRFSLLYSDCSEITFVDEGVGIFTLTLIDDRPTEVIPGIKNLILKIDTSLGTGASMVLPLIGNTISVDWGDGNIDNNHSHTYDADGVYTIVVKPAEIIRLRFADGGDKDKLQEVIQPGIKYKLGASAFFGCANLTSVSKRFRYIDTDLSYAFRGCSNLSYVADISNWDVSSVTSISFLFSGCSNFNSDLSNWDVSSVTSMQGTFQYCSNFNSDLSNWDVSSVTSMGSLFVFCLALRTDFSNWDVSSVTNMQNTFYNTRFPEIIFTHSLSNITIIDGCFRYNSGATTRLVLPDLSVSVDLSAINLVEEANWLELISSLADMTGKDSPTITVDVPGAGWTTACDNAAAAKNWTVAKV